MSSTIKEEEEEGQQQKLVNCAANRNTKSTSTIASTTINNSKNCRCKGSDVICNLSQFLTLVVSLSTLVLLLVMTFLATDDGQNSQQQFVPPRPDVAIWLQQISGFTWMPSYFQVWSSELKNQQQHNLSKIEGR